MSGDELVFGEFPELRDSTSELYIETGKRFRHAVFEGGMPKTVGIMYVCAKMAREAIRSKEPEISKGETNECTKICV